MKRDKEACHCKNVTYGQIEDAKKAGANTVEEVQKATGAGKGCGQCKENALSVMVSKSLVLRINRPGILRK